MLKAGIYDFVIFRGGTDMCFVLGFGRKRSDLKQYRISGLTVATPRGVFSLNNLTLGGLAHSSYPQRHLLAHFDTRGLERG